MIKLELTYQEAETLHKVLREHLADIANERQANAIEDFAELLKQEESSIKNIVDYLVAQGMGIPAEMFGGYPE
jgi:predicted transcriptional regulator